MVNAMTHSDEKRLIGVIVKHINIKKMPAELGWVIRGAGNVLVQSSFSPE